MHSTLLVLCRTLRPLALGVFIGGLPVMGAIVAPVAFRHSGLEPSQAGLVVGTSFLRFNVLCYVAGVLLLLAEYAEWGVSRDAPPGGQRTAGLRVLLAAALLGLTLYLGLAVAPEIFRYRAHADTTRFAALHGFYSIFANVQLLLAAGIAFLAALQSVKERSLSPTESVERNDRVRQS